MSTQLDLPVKSHVPIVKQAEVRAVLVVLRRSRDWMTARQICEAVGTYSTALERKVRACASVAAPAIVSFPGSPGYKFWDFCTVQEIDRCIDALESQGKDMIKRANVYRIAYHRKHREPIEVPTQEALALG
ncbi:MAG: hypothetical protein ABIZ04_20900 [Opitutus sp.]